MGHEPPEATAARRRRSGHGTNGGFAQGRAAFRVFIPAAATIVAFVLFAGIFTDRATAAFSYLQEEIVSSLGWYYIILVTALVLLVIVLGVGRFGDIKLGRDEDEPEFSVKAWLAMLFAAGMGIGLVFWGVAEPLSHLAFPRPGTPGAVAAQQSDQPLWFRDPALANQAADAGQESLIQTYLHWGVHPWAIYAVVGLAVGYAVHRRGRPVSIRWALEPLLGRRVRGWLGDLIDIISVVGTVFGVATSLGLGVLQIAEGMGLVWGWDAGTVMQVGLICAITLVATLSVVTGVGRGIKWLSQTNISLAALLLLFVLLAAPTLVLIRGFVESIGAYLQNFIRLSFELGGTRGGEGLDWAATWTTFYWGWWISWAPFVGIFIARISRGRTVREFVIGVLLVPTSVSFLWFAVLGGAGINQELAGDGGLVQVVDGLPVVSEEGALFGLLETLPAAALVSSGVIILIALFFITSSDSGSLVVDMISSGGDPDPPTWSRVFWALLEGAVAIALLLMVGGGEGLEALQTAAIVAALPVSAVLIAMSFALWRQLAAERLAMVRAERRRRVHELAEEVSQHMIDEGIIDDGRTRHPTPPRRFLERLGSLFRRRRAGNDTQMQRGSSKHGPAMDDEMAREAQSHTRGQPGGSRAEEWREPEPAGEDQPEPTMIPEGAHPAGAPEPLTGEELEARSEFGRWVPLGALPARRDELVRAADSAGAPAEVLADLQTLPEEREFATVYEIWDALGHRNEPESSTGREDSGVARPAVGDGTGEPPS